MGFLKLLPPKLRQQLLLNGLLALLKQGEAQQFGSKLKATLLTKKDDLLEDQTVYAVLNETAVWLKTVAKELEA